MHHIIVTKVMLMEEEEEEEEEEEMKEKYERKQILQFPHSLNIIDRHKISQTILNQSFIKEKPMK